MTGNRGQQLTLPGLGTLHTEDAMTVRMTMKMRDEMSMLMGQNDPEPDYQFRGTMGSNNVVRCSKCCALISQDDKMRHNMWHAMSDKGRTE